MTDPLEIIARAVSATDPSLAAVWDERLGEAHAVVVALNAAGYVIAPKEPSLRRGFMCAVDFHHEVGDGGPSSGNVVFPTEGDCREHRKCVTDCGMVEVEIGFVREIN